MTKKGLMAGIALLVLVNAFVLAGTAWNRWGSPDTDMVLTERELPLEWVPKENSGRSLRIQWQEDSTQWFNKEKLEEAGFDCSFPLEGKESDLFYRKVLPREGYVVLEYQGKAWETWISDKRRKLHEKERWAAAGKANKDDLEAAQSEMKWAALSASRLFAIDASRDADKLRRKYPDGQRFLILPAELSLRHHVAEKEKNVVKVPAWLSGDVGKILTESITVPHSKRAVLDKLLGDGKKPYFNSYSYYQGDQSTPPAYAARIKVGQRHEPWIVEISELKGK